MAQRFENFNFQMPMIRLPTQASVSGDTRLMRFMVARPAGLKLLVLLVVSTVLVFLRSPHWLAAGAVMSLTCWVLLGRGSGHGGDLRPGKSGVLWFLLMISAFGAYSAWLDGASAALATIARLMALIVLAMVVMRTTPVTQMMAAIERALQPFDRLGLISSRKTALAFGMMIRFLPVLREQWVEIQQAQTARGLNVRPHALLVPMLARTLKRAQEVAETLDARGLVD